MTMPNSKLQFHPVGAFICAVLFLFGYPALLMLVHDLPHFPALRLRRLLEPVGPPHFRFEELILASFYISLFVFMYTLCFGRDSKVQFALLAVGLALVGYGVGVYLAADIYPMQIYRLHAACDAEHCFPYLGNGIVILFATASSLILTE